MFKNPHTFIIDEFLDVFSLRPTFVLLGFMFKFDHKVLVTTYVVWYELYKKWVQHFLLFLATALFLTVGL